MGSKKSRTNARACARKSLYCCSSSATSWRSPDLDRAWTRYRVEPAVRPAILFSTLYLSVNSLNVVGSFVQGGKVLSVSGTVLAGAPEAEEDK